MPVVGGYGSGLDDSMSILLRKMLIPVAEKRMFLHNWANTKSEQKGTDVRRFDRLLRIARQESTYTPGTLLALSAVTKKFVTNHLDITPLWHRDAVYIDEDVDVMSMINDPQKMGRVADQFAESMEHLLAKTLMDEGMWWRVDTDVATPNQVNGAVLSVNGTVSFGSEQTEADDFWNDSQIVMYDPKLASYDEAAIVTDYDLTGGNVEKEIFASFTNTTEIGQKYFMVRKDGITAADVLTITNLVELAYLHDRARSPLFNGSTIRSVIAPENKADLMLDSDWKAYVQHDRSIVTEEFELLRWFSHEMAVSDLVIRTDTDNTDNFDDGVVFNPVFFGRDSYAVHHWPSISGPNEGIFGVEFGIVGDRPDSGNVTASKRAFWWKAIHGRAVLRATNVITAVCGATDRGFDTLT